MELAAPGSPCDGLAVKELAAPRSPCDGLAVMELAAPRSPCKLAAAELDAAEGSWDVWSATGPGGKGVESEVEVLGRLQLDRSTAGSSSSTSSAEIGSPLRSRGGDGVDWESDWDSLCESDCDSDCEGVSTVSAHSRFGASVRCQARHKEDA